jgi:hypothetical protein
MIRVRYTANDSNEVWLDEGRQAVAEPYADLDQGQGGVTRGDLREEDIWTLDTFDRGADVFVESVGADDVLDDTDEATARDTRIFWRAVVLAAEDPG